MSTIATYHQPKVESFISADQWLSAKLLERWLVPFLCSKGGITVEELKSGSRESQIVMVRQALSYFLFRYSVFTLNEIAEIVGVTHHSTIIHHRDTFIAECEVMPSRRDTNKAIEREIGKAYRKGLIKSLITLPSREKHKALTDNI